MFEKERFYIYANAVGLNRTQAEHRAVARVGDNTNFEDLTEKHFIDLNEKLIEILKQKNTPIPETTFVEELSVDEVRNILKPCQHIWVEYEKVGNNKGFCLECSSCGAIAFSQEPEKTLGCNHPQARLALKSPTKFVSYCEQCLFWLIEPMRNRTK